MQDVTPAPEASHESCLLIYGRPGTLITMKDVTPAPEASHESCLLIYGRPGT
jgi:hypothetical protein